VKKKCLVVIGVLLIILVTHNIVQAITQSELEQRRIELQTRIAEMGKTLENVDVVLTENLEAINNLDADILVYEEQMEKISDNLRQVENEIKETEEQLATVQERYNHQEEIFKQRLVYLYESGPTRYLDVLLSSKSIVDFISKYYLISEIAEYDKDLLTSIGEEKARIAEIEQDLEDSKELLKETKSEQKKVVIGLENSKVVKTSYVNNLTKEEKELQEAMDLYQQELDIIELQILLASLEKTGSDYIGGEFAWPVPGYYTITSKYGMRFHPILKRYTKHSGLDIGAPTGVYIIAANDGVVTQSTYSYSYGNMVMVSHGGGVYTLYAHGSEILKNVGDVVKRGDAIMRVGSTGWSTGPHLHFEIRVNGQTIDPYNYIISTQSEIEKEEEQKTDEKNEVNQEAFS